MSDDRVELKPCPLPWCKESLPELQQGGFRNRYFRVECQTCFTKGPTRDDLNGGGPAAIAAWNQRDPSIESLQAEMERLREALESIVEWMDDNRRTLDGEYSMDELLVEPRAILASLKQPGGR